MITGVVPPERLGETQLSRGGRLLAWAEWGPESGTPVLLCPGAATSRWLGFGADVLADLDVRLVSVDRPGLGASTPARGRSLNDWAADIRELVSKRSLDIGYVVGFSQGAPFALACVAAGVARGSAIVSGTDELAHPALKAHLDAGLSSLVERAVSDPAGAEATFSQMSADAVWDIIVRTSGDEDRAIYTDAGFEQQLRRALAEAFAQGPAGYARDTVLAMSPWPFDPGEIRVPVELWYGARDTSPVHSPDHGATLSRRIPTARLHVLPDAGGALLWTHAETVLRSLLAPERPLRTA